MLAFSKCQLVSERTVHEEGYLSTCEKNTGYLHSTWVGAGGGGGGEKEKESISFQTKWPSQLPPLPTLAPEVPQVSLRDPVSIGPLRSERSVHHSQWILSVLLPPDKSNAAKQNNCEKEKTPCGRPTPPPPPPLCEQEHAWLSLLSNRRAPHHSKPDSTSLHKSWVWAYVQLLTSS